ncbi:hypothetical protein [Parafrankia discariae]|uniref:hypothetical protein n=1 Tax=Parafrankia discariae TaxID=365528 RepID=UPI00047629CE|nr:hypothetical protein [Parafrankia discariae]
MAWTLLRLAAWVVATALAVTLSWFAVNGVLAGDTLATPSSAVAIDPPDVPSLPPADPPPGPPSSASSTPPSPSSTALPESAAVPPERPAAPAAAVPAAEPAPTGPAAAPPPAAAAPAPRATAQSYQLDGGRVVIETTDVSARLVSATPDVGWKVQAWQAEGWLRVDFSRDGRTSSCFVTWNGHPPSVQIT